MIQDVLPHVLDNQFKKRQLSEGDFLIWCRGGSVLIRKHDNEYEIPCAAVSDKEGEFFTPWGTTITENDVQFLLTMDDRGFFWVKEEILPEDSADGYEYVHMQLFSRMDPRWIGFGAASSVHLIGWYKSMKYCGVCGCKMQHDSKERMMFCSECGNVQYPKICPVVIVGVIKGNKMLLTKYANRGRYAHFSLVAGFAEFAESIEDTVIREVKEETNLEVGNLHFYKSQPWAFSSSLLMGFFCELKGDDNIVFNDAELDQAVWMDPCEMPDDTDHISLTAEMMQQFRKYGRDVLTM